jgi:hypothetical protein
MKEPIETQIIEEKDIIDVIPEQPRLLHGQLEQKILFHR